MLIYNGQAITSKSFSIVYTAKCKEKEQKTKIVPINTGNLNSRISKAISKGTPSKKKIVPVVNAQTTNRLYTAITESTAAKMKPVPKSIRQNKKRTKSKTNEIIYQLII